MICRLNNVNNVSRSHLESFCWKAYECLLYVPMGTAPGIKKANIIIIHPRGKFHSKSEANCKPPDAYLNKMKPIDVTAARLTSSFTSDTWIIQESINFIYIFKFGSYDAYYMCVSVHSLWIANSNHIFHRTLNWRTCEFILFFPSLSLDMKHFARNESRVFQFLNKTENCHDPVSTEKKTNRYFECHFEPVESF